MDQTQEATVHSFYFIDDSSGTQTLCLVAEAKVRTRKLKEEVAGEERVTRATAGHGVDWKPAAQLQGWLCLLFKQVLCKRGEKKIAC